jgi:hypothetical protein
MATPMFFPSECGELKRNPKIAKKKEKEKKKSKKKKRFVMYLRNFAQKNLTAREG